MSKNYNKLKNKRIKQWKVATKKVLISEEKSEKKKVQSVLIDTRQLFPI